MAQIFSSTIFYCLLHSIAFQKSTIAEDTLVRNQSIGVGQILVSQNQVFEMGFFSPGKSLNRFLGIWYKSTPDVVVWVANRNNPITASQAAVLMISRNGSLVISSGKSNIWSENPSSVASNPVLHLLDTGNLVLVDKTTKGAYLWESFDSPTDTFLPGMKLICDAESSAQRYLTSWRNTDDPSPGDFSVRMENHGLPEMVIFKGEKKRYRNGKWNGIFFSGVPRPQIPSRLYHPSVVFREERMLSMIEPYDKSVLIRVTIYSSGLFLRYIMNASKDKWNLVFTHPQDTCDEYGACGPNGVCSVDKPIRCGCLKGFAPKLPKDWDLQDWSGGCRRVEPLNCEGGGNGFLEVRGVKYPDMLQFWLNMSMNLQECGALCLQNCSCTAYANPYITNGGSGCVMWFGDLVDTRELPAADNRQKIYIRLPISELASSTNMEEEKGEEKKKNGRMNSIMISIASGVLVSGFINGGIILVAKRKRRAAKGKHEDIELPLFKMATIVEATNDFSSENMIGVGGFGPVYKGKMTAGEEIAVKRLSRSSRQGLEEFKNEVILTAKLQHRNLVRLLGCCIDGEERMLIYEYLPNKSLDYFVFDQQQRTLLTWPNRFDIIMGISRGLVYLHHDSRLKIIHRDFKTSNILLDGNLNPKISDLGLARIFEEEQSIARTKRVVGTYGYMAPEYAIDGKFSVKSDIFSLGVVLLEIISGKKNRGFEHNDHHHSLLGHAWLLWRENRMLEFLDECLSSTFVESQVKRCVHVGLLCVQKYAEDRPIMSSVLFMLGSDGAVLPQPKEPGFFYERSCGAVPSCTSPTSKSENRTITITDLEAR